MTRTTRHAVGLHLRITLGSDIAIGPGKAELLEGIRETGSIAAAGRRMKMSYKRAWTLIDSMNACFREPVVETSRGGHAHGGATLTATGEAVLASYQRMCRLAGEAIAGEMQALQGMATDISGRK